MLLACVTFLLFPGIGCFDKRTRSLVLPLTGRGDKTCSLLWAFLLKPSCRFLIKVGLKSFPNKRIKLSDLRTSLYTSFGITNQVPFNTCGRCDSEIQTTEITLHHSMLDTFARRPNLLNIRPWIQTHLSLPTLNAPQVIEKKWKQPNTRKLNDFDFPPQKIQMSAEEDILQGTEVLQATLGPSKQAA